jgi:hypothetical protein
MSSDDGVYERSCRYRSALYVKREIPYSLEIMIYIDSNIFYTIPHTSRNQKACDMPSYQQASKPMIRLTILVKKVDFMSYEEFHE